MFLVLVACFSTGLFGAMQVTIRRQSIQYPSSALLVTNSRAAWGRRAGARSSEVANAPWCEWPQIQPSASAACTSKGKEAQSHSVNKLCMSIRNYWRMGNRWCLHNMIPSQLRHPGNRKAKQRVVQAVGTFAPRLEMCECWTNVCE